MGRLARQIAIVTGASRGIGAEIARLFAAEGARVVCAARTLREGDHPFEGSLETTVAAIREAGGQAHAIAVNIAEPAECERLVAETRATYGPVDVLVNNAALTYYIPIVDYPVNRWLRSWAVNVHAPFVLSQLVLRDMMPRKRGAIVNISSGAAIGPGRGPYPDPALGARGGTCYGAEKAALERFTQGLASEVYQHGVSVTALSPSQVVPTPGTVHHRLVRGLDDPRGEPPGLMAQAALLLASEPYDRVSGRVCYSQQILHEFGWITEAKGRGVTTRGSGYSEL
jgi:citronellol/citronellal dehydrogenase